MATISKEQQLLNSELHKNNAFGNRNDGAGTAKRLPMALDKMNKLGYCNSVLDYGTGKGKLLKYLSSSMEQKIKIEGYDPSFAEYQNKPQEKFDIVTCLDVLEHIELSNIQNVLYDIKKYTRHFAYLVIDLQPAVKTLADGRNAHILLAPPEWWQSKIASIFPAFSTFPIYHNCGEVQKIAIFAACNNKSLAAMNIFINKLNIFEMCLSGGVLNKRFEYLKNTKG